MSTDEAIFPQSDSDKPRVEHLIELRRMLDSVIDMPLRPMTQIELRNCRTQVGDFDFVIGNYGIKRIQR